MTTKHRACVSGGLEVCGTFEFGNKHYCLSVCLSGDSFGDLLARNGWLNHSQGARQWQDSLLLKVEKEHISDTFPSHQ